MGDRLRPLTRSQASNCENAREPECKCRCGGAGHGGKRAPAGREDDPTWYQELPETDPHHLPSDVERQHLKRQRKYVNGLRTQIAMWEEGHEYRKELEIKLEDALRELARIEGRGARPTPRRSAWRRRPERSVRRVVVREGGQGMDGPEPAAQLEVPDLW